MAQQPDPKAEIRTLIERWATSVRAHDIDGGLAQHAPDILMFDVVPTELAARLNARRARPRRGRQARARPSGWRGETD